ncbi:hypothetical protein O3G_MSEX014599 [Manduca sexta]|uniref:Uncharacterized protein n=1 Tax=Manduca sexta TaxID=7130 RepID=A0A921ZVX0_MANSE|nr:hypothetical protein O3G_MSEX014599 [Manduca sexta]
MELFYIFYIYFILPKVKSNVVSEENQDKTEKEDKTIYNIGRQFIDDLDDSQWHISHLKDLGFDSSSKCQGETFEDKALKYRRVLKNDGARVEFVSADPLPVDASDIKNSVCHVDNDVGKKESVVLTYNKTKENNIKKEDDDLNSKIESNKTVAKEQTDNIAQVNTATTVNEKATESDDVKVENEKEENKRRASEYIFSSVEYYDETADFDESVCHGAVEVFSLEIDQLRNYDVECEMLLEWRSLD